MNYQVFKGVWMGRRIDYDHVYMYQCVDLILQYAKDCFSLPTGVSGNAKDYWNKTSPALLTKFDKLATKDCLPGDIVVLYTAGHTGDPNYGDGHIGICDSQTASTIKLLEQNAAGGGNGLDRNAVGIWRDIAKTRIMGVLRPKAVPTPSKMPPVGSKIQLIPRIDRTCFRAGTTTVSGVIRVTDNTFIYTVRGYDPVFGYRVIINSKAGGGDGVALALYLTNGNIIGGWKQL